MPVDVVNDEEDSDEDIDDTDPSMGKDDASNMIVDTPESHTVDVPVNETKTKPPAAEEHGWEVVGPRRSRGKRN
ncbi:hypothetical protein M0R45_015914 [Rubus argutus]|uniref:Uncharacterized protein n=1 Tax=Rubus argutus TaxID=59490 RepID=A0AAW1XTK8_RUBAR